ncbi:MAG TPA: hypothetical protein DEG69_18295 [Flavobacteriaceae bacterium]|nr:hypothetical protein [Flavobacteriaceae bacterium]
MENKTHWKQNPNKNYLGHYDLPNGDPVILTMNSVEWEQVLNPVKETSENKRVIRFKEKFKWIKPFICNETNANLIAKSTGKNYLEDWPGLKVKLGVSKVQVGREKVDAIRVKNVPQSELQEKVITADQVKTINKKITEAKKDVGTICKALGIKSIDQLQAHRYDTVINRLKEIKNGNN